MNDHPAAASSPVRERRRRHLRDAPVPLRKLVPNLFTTAALCSGIASFHFTDKGDWAHAIAAIGMAALLDSLDGRFARLLNVTSRFGEVFDSMADWVAFGIGPAFLLYRWSKQDLSFMGYNLEGLVFVSVVLFVFCSAFRLARFTAMQRRKKVGSKPSNFFSGMPTPAAAGAALIPPMIYLSDFGVRVPTPLVIVLTITIALLMVSRLPMFSFKRLRIKRSWLMPLMLLVALVVAGFVRDAWLTASLLCAAYLASLSISITASAREKAAVAAPVPPAGPAAPAH
jgi:CDP-diacylglycerol--serine O-phosphatidyltransferase